MAQDQYDSMTDEQLRQAARERGVNVAEDADANQVRDALRQEDRGSAQG